MRTYGFHLLLLVGCTPEDTPTATLVDAIQFEDVWVFAYSEPPDHSMDALHTATASQVDGCLQVGDAVVIWREQHLGTVEDIVGRLGRGGSPTVAIGGGGLSLDEGSTLDDFPSEVVAHCAPTELWFAGREDPTVDPAK